MTPRSLASRLTLLQQVTGVAVIAVFAASALLFTGRAIKREQGEFLQATARHLAGNIDLEYREDPNVARAAAAAMDEESAVDVRIDVLDASGETLVSSQRAPAPGRPSQPGAAGGSPPGPSSPEIQKATARAGCGAVVVVSTSNRLRSAGITALGRVLLFTAVPLLLISLFWNRRLVRRALSPLAEMERRAREASAEEGLRSLGRMSGLAEIDALKESFDRLLVRLDDLLQIERRFTSDASHELRTPITVLLGELELVLGSSDLPADSRAGLERAFEQAGAMRDLVDALLLFRRTGPGGIGSAAGLEPVNLADLARDLGREFQAQEPARSADLRVAAPDEVLVPGQPALLASALRNLLGNALKFSRPGQPVHVSVGCADFAFVIVEDGGPGIPEDEREHIFDPFFRGKEARASHSGSGLGLPLLRRVARAHGGEVTVEDSALGGARFLLRLPLWPPAA